MSNSSGNAWSEVLSMNMLKLHILQEIIFLLSLGSSWPCLWSPVETHDMHCLHCCWIIMWWFFLAIIQEKVVDIGSGRNVGNRSSGGGSGGRGNGGGRSHGCYRRPCSSSTHSRVCLWFIKRTKLKSCRRECTVPNCYICSNCPWIYPVLISRFYFVLCYVFHGYHVQELLLWFDYLYQIFIFIYITDIFCVSSCFFLSCVSFKSIYFVTVRKLCNLRLVRCTRSRYNNYLLRV